MMRRRLEIAERSALTFAHTNTCLSKFTGHISSSSHLHQIFSHSITSALPPPHILCVNPSRIESRSSLISHSESIHKQTKQNTQTHTDKTHISHLSSQKDGECGKLCPSLTVSLLLRRVTCKSIMISHVSRLINPEP